MNFFMCKYIASIVIVGITLSRCTSVCDLPFPILIIDKSMHVKDMSLAYARLRDYDRDKTIGTSLYELGKNHPALQDLTTEFYQVFYTQRSGIIETSVHGEIWKAKVSPINEELIAIQLFNPSESNELQLQHTAKMFKHLVDNIRDYAVFMLNNEGVVVSWNEGSSRLLGYAADEIIGRHFSIFLPSEVRKADILSIANEKGKYSTETWRLKKDGSRFWASVLISPIYDDKQVHIGFSKLVKDLTLQLQSETAKDNFLALIQHEHRNLLNSIVVGINLLKQEKLDRDQTELVELIDDSSQNLMTMVNDLLDFSKFHSGFNLQTMIQTVDIQKLIEDLGKQYQILQQTNTQVSVQYQIDTSLPKFVRIDPMRLQQVLRNLLSNALKFTERGTVCLQMDFAPFPDKSPMDVASKLHIEQLVAVRFQVSDTGIGIDEVDYDKIFQSFTQIDSSNTKRQQGTGIGLVISQKIIEMMGGKILFASQKDVGTTFWFDLVLEFVRPSVELERRASDLAVQHYDASQIGVLLIEDNKINQKVMVRILQRRGFAEIDIANDGQEAIDQYYDNKDKYQLIICDISIPIFDGIQVTEIIRKTNVDIPIVAVTGNATPKDQEKCLNVGMNAILTKPINIQKFDKILNDILSQLVT